MLKAIIFDYDGVIVDSFPTLHEVYKIMCTAINKECPDDIEEFRTLFGHDYHECYDNLGFTSEQKMVAGKIYSEQIRKFNPPLFPGIIELLKRLQKYQLFVVSSNSYPAVSRKLESEKLLHFFEEIQGHPIGNAALEKPPVIADILKRHNIGKDEVLLIGDRINDYNDAQEANIPVVLVDYGWKKDSQKIGQQHSISAPMELLNVIGQK